MLIFAIGLLAAALGCGHQDGPGVTNDERSSSSLEDVKKIQELVVRDLLMDVLPKRREREVYYLSFGNGIDPSPAFLHHLAAHVGNVLPASSAQNPDVPTKDRKEWEAGVFLRVGQPKWLGGTEVQVEGSWSRGPLWARGYRYQFAWRDIGWVVKAKIGTFVS